MIVNSPPDGYLLLISSSAIAALPAIQPTLPYDTQNDLTPIASLVALPAVVMVSPSSGIRSIDQLVEKARKSPGMMSFGSSGVGSASHLDVERLRAAAKIKLLHIPYRGAPEAITDAAAGRVDFVIAPLAAGRALIDDNKLVAIASTSTSRSPLIPDVPTIKESGFDMRSVAWVGLLGPEGMPADLVKRIHDAATAALASPDVKQGLGLIAAEVLPMASLEFRKLIAGDIANNRDLLAEASAIDRR